MHLVQFFFNNRRPTLRDRTKLKSFIKSIFLQEKKEIIKLSYIFCSDKQLLNINKLFLNHDFYTDVITFNLSQTLKQIDGEVYISVDRVKYNAKVFGVSYTEELHRVMFHGALHLCGYGDKKRAEILQMRLKEDECIKIYFK